MLTACRLLCLPLVALLPAGASAQAPPGYARDVVPIFKAYCVECHHRGDPEAGLDLESYKALRAGGDRGPAVVPGRPDASLLVRLIEHRARPAMPPRKSKQPSAAEVAVVRAWVAAGAKDGAAAGVVRLPALAPKGRVATPITAAACTPDGKTLAVSGRGEVLLLDAGTGEVRSRLPAGHDRVTAVAFDPRGTTLAAAASTAGVGHEVRLWRSAAGTWQGPGAVAATHGDVVQGLAFSADGKLLASAGYDRLVKVWDVAAGKQRFSLKDHSDSVYSVSFSPDGKLLASGGADRAVKVWDLATGNRLYTLGESTDWVYAVAWSPVGNHLAAAGVDRSIRVWQADGRGGRIVRSAFAHEKAVTRLAYAADGKTLYSVGADDRARAWDPVTLAERLSYPRQAETVLALALRPAPAEVLLGRYDGVLVALDGATGKSARQLLPAPPRPPVLKKVSPAEVVRGRPATLTFTGRSIDGAAVISDPPGLSATVKGDRATLTVPAGARPGRYGLRLKNDAGESAALSIVVDRFAVVAEVEPNDSARTGQAIALPATVVGAVGRAGDVDWYHFEGKAGEEVGVQALTAEVGSKLDPVLTLVDPAGDTVAQGSDGHLGHRCARAGRYALGVRDRDFRGGADLTYRLNVGPVPVVTSYFPLGLRQGTATDVTVEGVNLGKSRTVRVEAAKAAAPGSRIAVPVTTAEGPPLGSPSLLVGEFAETSEADKGRTLPIPGTANGRIAEADAAPTWRFRAKKGQRLVMEVNAARLGSALDSTIEILDGAGRPLPRAVLRSEARTFMAFRDHESRTPGIRIETWGELAVNDFILVGSELLRIRALPRNPDDDCQFFAEGGQRLGYLGTTPVHQSQGTPMYKVSVHPPGTRFSANGLPLVTVFWRNDDGGPGFGKDSRLAFDPPADGDYQVRIRDARGEGGPGHAYRLTVRPPRPDFTVRVSVPAAVSKGGSVPVRVDVNRLDDFDGVIDLRLAGLPAGWSAPATNVGRDDNGTVVALSADGKAAAPAKPIPIPLEARATIAGKEVLHEASATLPRLIEPGDVVTTTAENEVQVKPGAEVRLTVQVERRNGFAGRIPVEVQGLPHGVRVLDVGLNGILITPTETRRTIVLYCEPWVAPTAHPIVALARHEGKGSEHAARSVLLRVGK